MRNPDADATEVLNVVGHTDTIPDSDAGRQSDEIVGSLNNQVRAVTEDVPVNADVQVGTAGIDGVGTVNVDPQASQQSVAGDNHGLVAPAGGEAVVDNRPSPQV